MPTLRSVTGFSSPITITATLSIVLLVGVVGFRVYSVLHPEVAEVPNENRLSAEGIPDEWRAELAKLGIVSDSPTTGSSTTDEISLIGPIIATQLLNSYEEIKAKGDYTQEDLRKAAEEIAVYMKADVTYKRYEAADFVTVADSSAERVRVYRDELQSILAPLSSIESAEYVIYARYEETKDPTYLVKLASAAEMYRTVAQAAADITVPRDAINPHTDLVNALQGFAAVLQGLSEHGDDPFASVALLRTYNEKEAGIYASFNGMRSYYGRKAI